LSTPPQSVAPTEEPEIHDSESPLARFRPRIPLPRPDRHLQPIAVGVFLLVLVYLQFEPIFEVLGSSILGDPETDAIKGMWSFDHIRRSMLPPETPIWSSQANYPEGVLALVLPWVSSVLLSPLGGIFGPITGWNLSILTMVWALGMSLAWLVQVTTKSWAAGAVAGAAMISQPMLFHAIGDGTPEHVSLWTIPIFLVAAWKALSEDVPAWGVAAGLAATLVALDSPYNAIYAFLIGIMVLPFAMIRRREGAWIRQMGLTVGMFLLAAGIGTLLIWLLYRNFPLDETSQEVALQSTADQSCQQEVAGYASRGEVCLDRFHEPMSFTPKRFDPSSGNEIDCQDEVRKFCSMNTTDVWTWWKFDTDVSTPRDPSLAPTLIPRGVLVPFIFLAMLGAPRAIPWLIAGVLMTCLSLDLNTANPGQLQEWMGEKGTVIGEQILALNAWMGDFPGINKIRFPQRWLLPGVMCILVSGSYGLARLFKWLRDPPTRRLESRFPRLGLLRGKVPSLIPKCVILIGAAWLAIGYHDAGIAASRVRNPSTTGGAGFPSQEIPEIEFAQWVRDQPGEGAFVLLPEARPAPKTGQGPMRAELPVFANIDKSVDDKLSGSDKVFLQVMMNRPSLHYPGLKTLQTMSVPDDKYRIMRNWDDMTHPVLTGNSIPSSVYDPRHTADRQRIITELRKAGLRFVIVDRAVYNDEALELLTNQLEQHTLSVQEFEDGDGVIVFELGER
jgi:hypothetical protein